jgi:hypothetical protein
MIVTSYNIHPTFVTSVANAAKTDKGDVISHTSSSDLAVWVNCDPFELPEGKWFGISGGLIVRFPAEKEHDWRVKKATELVESGVEDPVVLYQNAQNAAYLLNINLNEFLKQLRSLSQDPNEDLTNLYKKWQSKLNTHSTSPAPNA